MSSTLANSFGKRMGTNRGELYGNIHDALYRDDDSSFKSTHNAPNKTVYLASNVALTNGDEANPKTIPNLYKAVDDISKMAADKSTADQTLWVKSQPLMRPGSYVDGIKTPQTHNAKMVTLFPQYSDGSPVNATGNRDGHTIFNIDANEIYFTIDNVAGKINVIPLRDTIEIDNSSYDSGSLNHMLQTRINALGGNTSSIAYIVKAYFVPIDDYSAIIKKQAEDEYIVAPGSRIRLLYHTMINTVITFIYEFETTVTEDDELIIDHTQIQLSGYTERSTRSLSADARSVTYQLRDAYIIKTQNNWLIITKDMLNTKGEYKLAQLANTNANAITELPTKDENGTVALGFVDSNTLREWVEADKQITSSDTYFTTYGKHNTRYIRLCPDSGESVDFKYRKTSDQESSLFYDFYIDDDKPDDDVYTYGKDDDTLTGDRVCTFSHGSRSYASINHTHADFDSVGMFRVNNDSGITLKLEEHRDASGAIVAYEYILSGETETITAYGDGSGWNNVKPEYMLHVPTEYTVDGSDIPAYVTIRADEAFGDGDIVNGDTVTIVKTCTEITVQQELSNMARYFVISWTEDSKPVNVVVPYSAVKPGSMERSGQTYTIKEGETDILDTRYGFHPPYLYSVSFKNGSNNNDGYVIESRIDYDASTFDQTSITITAISADVKLYLDNSKYAEWLIDDSGSVIGYYDPPEQVSVFTKITAMQDMVAIGNAIRMLWVPSILLPANWTTPNATDTVASWFDFDGKQHPAELYSLVVQNGVITHVSPEKITIDETVTFGSLFGTGMVTKHDSGVPNHIYYRGDESTWIDDSGERLYDYYDPPHTDVVIEGETHTLVRVLKRSLICVMKISQIYKYRRLIIPFEMLNPTTAAEIDSAIQPGTFSQLPAGDDYIGSWLRTTDIPLYGITLSNELNIMSAAVTVSATTGPKTSDMSSVIIVDGEVIVYVPSTMSIIVDTIPGNTIDYYDPPTGPVSYTHYTPTSFVAVPYPVKQPYSLRAIIEAIQELNRRTAYMDGGIGIFDANMLHDVAQTKHNDAVHEGTADGLPGLVHSNIYAQK